MSTHLNVGHSGYGDSAEAAACWERWFYSENGREPRHLAFSEHQWGSIFGCGGALGRPHLFGKHRENGGEGFRNLIVREPVPLSLIA